MRDTMSIAGGCSAGLSLRRRAIPLVL